MFYVPRDQMPQVKESDLPSLVAWLLKDQATGVEFDAVPPADLHAHQRVDHRHVQMISTDHKAMLKPVLVSSDHFVIDGNHRWSAHAALGDDVMAVIRIDVTFDNAITLLAKFPATYHVRMREEDAV